MCYAAFIMNGKRPHVKRGGGEVSGQTHLNSFDNNILGVRSDEFDVL